MNEMLNLRGPTFLALYGVLFVIAFIAGRAIRANLKSAIHNLAPSKTWSPYDLAYLSGGSNRAVATALVRLTHQGHLQAAPSGSGIKATTEPKQSAHPLEKELYLAFQENQNFSDWESSQGSLADIVGNLQSGGLISNPNDPAMQRAHLWGSLPLALLTLLGISKLWVGLSNHRPISFLVLMLVISLIILVREFVALAETTSRGHLLLKHFMHRNAALETTALSRAQHLSELDLLLGVALFGTVVLAGTEFSWLNVSGPLRDRPDSGSPGGGDRNSSDRDGGGGCGGGSGGCSGCGGCG